LGNPDDTSDGIKKGPVISSRYAQGKSQAAIGSDGTLSVAPRQPSCIKPMNGNSVAPVEAYELNIQNEKADVNQPFEAFDDCLNMEIIEVADIKGQRYFPYHLLGTANGVIAGFKYDIPHIG